ncbi:hypothetical protein ASG65_11325 [Bacillus sp. Leaf13]|nr:hypothetical protein ASG65_11325 [Bacillus sp. Leaf13]
MINGSISESFFIAFMSLLQFNPVCSFGTSLMEGWVFFINRVLVSLAIIIFILNFFISPVFFGEEPSSNGTFIGLILLCICLISLIDEVKKK